MYEKLRYDERIKQKGPRCENYNAEMMGENITQTGSCVLILRAPPRILLINQSSSANASPYSARSLLILNWRGGT